MITLYHCMNARSFRPLWTLEELGLDYELKMLPFPPRVLAKEYLGINPLGTIPLFLDGDVRMTESAAICQYLATRYGPTSLAVEPDEPAFGAYLNWLTFGEATLTFPQTIVFRYTQLESEERRLPQAVEDYRRWYLGRVRGVEAIVAKEQYICAGRFTVADISIGFALMFSEQIKLFAQLPEVVQRYWLRLKERDGFQRALMAQQLAAADQGVAAAPPRTGT
jgi:glutathione S-transferase